MRVTRREKRRRNDEFADRFPVHDFWVWKAVQGQGAVLKINASSLREVLQHLVESGLLFSLANVKTHQVAPGVWQISKKGNLVGTLGVVPTFPDVSGSWPSLAPTQGWIDFEREKNPRP